MCVCMCACMCACVCVCVRVRVRVYCSVQAVDMFECVSAELILLTGTEDVSVETENQSCIIL